MFATIRRLSALALALAVVAMVAPTTVLGQTTDSSTWELKYEGDVTPDNASPAFTQASYYRNSEGQAEPTVTNTSDGNILTLTVTGAEHNAENGWKTPSIFGGGTGSIEFRARVLSGNGVVRFRGANGLGFDSGLVWTAPDQWGGGGPSCSGTCGGQTLPGGRQITDWNIYRGTRSGDGTFSIYVADSDNGWIDNSAIATYTVGGSIGNGQIGFEVTGGPGNGQIELDYFRATNAGAFAPEVIPEPAGLALLSLGALALLRRRR
jgi:MYXO-CTERM domain-containing protein